MHKILPFQVGSWNTIKKLLKISSMELFVEILKRAVMQDSFELENIFSIGNLTIPYPLYVSPQDWSSLTFIEVRTILKVFFIEYVALGFFIIILFVFHTGFNLSISNKSC